MTLFDQISQDIVAAMKAKDKGRLMALRNVKKLFIEAKTAPGANDELTDEAAMKILAKLSKQGRDTAELYVSQNRPDLAEEEMVQVLVVEEYLPKPLTEDELKAALTEIIAEVGATSAKEMGKVMGVASKRLAGKADGKAISAMVKTLLA
ncbi:MAG: GatB/YqeY domain-containing protein [Bacteroidaceae bacterium]|nr:GatB/YqeY domain-containing protein [Bacteroidaceae bacterium]